MSDLVREICCSKAINLEDRATIAAAATAATAAVLAINLKCYSYACCVQVFRLCPFTLGHQLRRWRLLTTVRTAQNLYCLPYLVEANIYCQLFVLHWLILQSTDGRCSKQFHHFQLLEFLCKKLAQNLLGNP
jgi:hypothetical protein